MPEIFKHEGKKFWKAEGDFDEHAECFCDFVSRERYVNILKRFDLRGKKIIDLGSGMPKSSPSSPASELPNVIETLGGKIIPADISIATLRRQKQLGRSGVTADVFSLPFKDKTINGGAISLNLFNASCEDLEGDEVLITYQEVEEILREVFRILQEKTFFISSTFGYSTFQDRATGRCLNPVPDNLAITVNKIKSMAEGIGFKNVSEIPLDLQRIGTVVKDIEQERKDLNPKYFEAAFQDPGAVFMEK